MPALAAAMMAKKTTATCYNILMNFHTFNVEIKIIIFEILFTDDGVHGDCFMTGGNPLNEAPILFVL